jgi:hypothetical protein
MVPKQLLLKLLNAPAKGFNKEFCKRQIDSLVTEHPALKKLLIFW